MFLDWSFDWLEIICKIRIYANKNLYKTDLFMASNERFNVISDINYKL